MRFVTRTFDSSFKYFENELFLENGKWKLNGDDIPVLKIQLIQPVNATPLDYLGEKLVYIFKHPITLKVKNYLMKKRYTQQYENGKFDDSAFIKSIIFVNENKSRKYCKTLLRDNHLNVINVVFIDNNIAFIYKDNHIQVFTPLKQYIYDMIGKIEFFKGYYMPDILNEMLKKPKVVEINTSEEKINILFSDGMKNIKISKMSLLQSDYINNLIENLQKDEILEVFSELTFDEFSHCFIGMWRANESKIVSFLSKIDSVVFNKRCKFLLDEIYLSIENKEKFNFEKVLYLYL